MLFVTRISRNTCAQAFRTIAQTIAHSPIEVRPARRPAGIAVYVTASTVHLLRLAVGHDTALTPQGSARYTRSSSPGLFYSHDVDDPKRPGRVAFVPAAALPSRGSVDLTSLNFAAGPGSRSIAETAWTSTGSGATPRVFRVAT